MGTKKKMCIESVRTGRIEKPIRVLMYGTDGVGKTTFAADAPGPVFLAAEDGTAQLDVARFPEPETFTDVMDALGELLASDHDFRTVVVDTVDWLEPLIWSHVCSQAGVDNIEKVGGGYGKGYVAALGCWREMLRALDMVRDRRGMHVVLLGHAVVRRVDPPDAELLPYDRYELKLNVKAGGTIREWADAVLFARWEMLTARTGDRKGKGVSTGARLMHTEHRAAFDAKNRFQLPETMPLSWDDFFSATRGSDPANTEALYGEAAKLLEAVDRSTATAAWAWLSKPTNIADVRALARMVEALRVKADIASREASREEQGIEDAAVAAEGGRA